MVSAGETEPGKNINGEMRAIAYDLAHAIRSGVDVSSLEDVNTHIARLTAGYDPDAFNTSQPEYAAGAETAYSMLVGALAEAMPSVYAMEKIKRPSFASMMIRLAAAGSLPEPELIQDTYSDIPPEDRIEQLNSIGIIEPAPPKEEADGRTWQLTPWATEIYPRILPYLAEAVGVDEALEGLRGILKDSED